MLAACRPAKTVRQWPQADICLIIGACHHGHGPKKGGRSRPVLILSRRSPLLGRCRIGIYEGIGFSLAGTAINRRLQRILNCHIAGNCSCLLYRELRRLLRCLFQILGVDIDPGLTGGLGCLLGGNAGYIGSLD